MQKSVITPEIGKSALTVKGEPKKPRSKPEVVVKDIMSAPLCEYIESCIRFKVPSEGIHKPMLWKNRENWGLIYKVLPKVSMKKLAKSKSLKYIIMQLRWKFRRGNLVPETGYEELCKTIDMGETCQLRELLNPNNS